jgi:hypothetical protein
VGEVGPGQVLGKRLALLVDVRGVGGDVRVVDDHGEGLRSLGRAGPAQVRAAVAAFGSRLAGAVRDAERVLVRHALTVRDAV